MRREGRTNTVQYSQVRREGRASWSDTKDRMDFHMERDDRLLATPIPSWDRARLKEEEWEEGWREKLQQGTFRLPSPPRALLETSPCSSTGNTSDQRWLSLQ